MAKAMMAAHCLMLATRLWLCARQAQCAPTNELTLHADLLHPA
jgi:hypothetical protein